MILSFPLAVKAGNIDPILKYAWGDKLGWVNFNPDGGEVSVSASAVRGYVWSANYGWINLNPDYSGVTNDGRGNLSGSAWSESLGWIDFNGVTINNGLFSGQAAGSQAGTLNFACDHCSVRTTWRETATTAGSTAVIPIYPVSATVIAPLSGQLSISSSDPEVNIPLSGGSEVKGVSFSLTPDFAKASILPFQENLSVNICPAGDCPAGDYEVWVKFFSSTGNSSEAQKVTVNYQGGGAYPDDRESFLNAERARATAANMPLSRRLSGRILLQVEDLGRAWYVYPKNLQRYYLGRPDDAFKVMRELSLGISNKNFAALTLADKRRLSGIILLKVEDSGRAYFVNPVDLKLYYLGRPDDARRIMRELALGITNNNLSQIKIAE